MEGLGVDFKQDRPLVPKFPMDFGAAGGLVDFGDNYTWFTPAFLYLWGRFTDQHLQCLMESTTAPQILMHTFQHPIFAGLEDRCRNPGWNHTLWAVESPSYPVLEQFLLTVATYDNQRQRVYRVGVQQFSIVDPLWHDLNPVVTAKSPRVTVMSFGVDANVGQVGFDLTHDPPSACRFPPRDTTRRFAKLVLSGETPVVVMDAELDPLPLPTSPARLEVKDVSNLSAEKQAEVADLIRRYRYFQQHKELR